MRPAINGVLSAVFGAVLCGLVSIACAQESPDYWIVSLAWSPEFCHNAPEFHEEPQCAEAHGFVLTRMEP